MLWFPPPEWLLAALAAASAHAATIVVLACRYGWKTGLLTLPISVVAFVLSLLAGIMLAIGVASTGVLPLLVVLGIGVYVTVVLGRAIGCPTARS